MKTSRFALLLVPLAMLGLTSCPETAVPRDFGTKPLKLKTADWEGTWRAAGESEDLRFEVKDAAGGRIVVHLPNKEKGTEEAIEAVVHETGAPDSEGLAFLTTFSAPGNEWGSLNLVTVPQKGVFHVWNLRHDVVEAAVKSGELTGRLKSVKEKNDEKPHNHTELSAEPANYPKVIGAKFWEWTKPSTYVQAPAK